MNISFFIAKRIAFNKQPSFSRFIIRLSVAATALSVASMILTIAFVNGFQQTVSNKVFKFWGQIRIQQLAFGKGIMGEEAPMQKNDSFQYWLKQQQGITHIQAYATKSAVIEQNKEIEGIMFKGLDTNFSTELLRTFLYAGKLPRLTDSGYSKQILLSYPLAKTLKVNVNDTVHVYFVQEGAPTARRKLQVCGIFKTGIEEFDKLFVIGDLRLIQRVNNWQPNQIGGYEVFVQPMDSIAAINKSIYQQLPTELGSNTIQEMLPNIFDWLNIQNVNRNILFIVMAFVAVINLITCLLILVLERTKMIGLLKAIGATNVTIQQIFLYYAALITLVGIGMGLILGVGLSLLQLFTHFITLDETAYYVSYAPVSMEWWQILVITLATAATCFLSLWLPTLLVKRMTVVKAIGFK